MTLIKCPHEGCNNWFEPTKKHGYTTKFCSRACANSRKFDEETNKLKTQRQKEWWERLTDDEKREYQESQAEHIVKANEAWKQKSLEELMKSDIEELSHEMRRKRIILEQNGKCNKCSLDEWFGNPISFELEQKDGDSKNNKRENLEALCPNCHSITPTWRGRNKNTGKKTVRDSTLLQALAECKNIRQALLKVGLAAKGTNYKKAKKLLEKRTKDR